MVLKRTVYVVVKTRFSTSESVEGTSLTLQSIDDIHGGDSLPLGVLGVGNGITDDVLKENLEYTTGHQITIIILHLTKLDTRNNLA